VKVRAVTPNWSLSRGSLPTDTIHPPRSFPLEWAYLRRDIDRTDLNVVFTVNDEYIKNRSIADFVRAEADAPADVYVVSTAPSYLFWRCAPTSLELVSRYVSGIRRGAPSARTVLVGPHATAEPSSTLKWTGADLALRGEIDPHLAPMLASLQAGEVPTALAAPGRPGIVQPEMPLVDRAASYGSGDLTGAKPHVWLPDVEQKIARLGGTYALAETARGCSFDCGYCFRAGFRRSLRLKPLAAVSEELRTLRDLGVSYVFMIDETFGVPRSHYRGVLAVLRELDLAFGLQTRPDVWAPDSIHELADSGCVYVELGTESLTVAGVTALSKYRDPAKVMRSTQQFREILPNVGVNIVDVGNPDLGLLPRALARRERDNEGERPPAFIPYMGTIWGEKALARERLPSTWRSVDRLHAVYSLAARNGPASWLLRESLLVRRITGAVLHIVGRGLPRMSWRSRHDRRYGPMSVSPPRKNAVNSRSETGDG